MRPLSDQTGKEHSNVTFNVTLTKPNHTVKWYLNGQELQPGDKFKPKQLDDTRFSLDVNDLALIDDGKIKCVIFNDKGEEVGSSEANLSVKGTLFFYSIKHDFHY
jgi:hypothetical protein